MDNELSGAHQIGEVAEIVGLSLRTIRHYEEVGLVPPSGRTAGGFRLYSDSDIERLRLVKLMKPLAFTLEEMRELLELRDHLHASSGPDPEQAGLVDRMMMFVAVADERCARLRDELEQVEGFARALRHEVSSTQGTEREPT
jgi:MerR family transcriptional regulator, copper efflux regulator